MTARWAGGGAVVHAGGGVQSDAAVAVSVVVLREERLTEPAGEQGLDELKEAWNAGQYLRVLNPASE